MHNRSNEFCILTGNDLEQEMKEITDFFQKIENYKNKILKCKEDSELRDSIYLSEQQIKQLLIQNINLINIITDDTIKIYIDSIFRLEEDISYENKYKFTDESLETFLTSILIFSDD